jgi:hypothetical protein
VSNEGAAMSCARSVCRAAGQISGASPALKQGTRRETAGRKATTYSTRQGSGAARTQDNTSQKGSAMEHTQRRTRITLHGLLRLGAMGLLAGAALVVPAIGSGAHADVGYCRACGTFNVVNGPQIGFSTFVPDATSSVQAINYTVHLPLGARLTARQIVGDLAGDVSVSVQNDAPRGTYSIDTDVVTSDSDTASTQTFAGLGFWQIGFGVTNQTFSVQADT